MAGTFVYSHASPIRLHTYKVHILVRSPKPYPIVHFKKLFSLSLAFSFLFFLHLYSLSIPLHYPCSYHTFIQLKPDHKQDSFHPLSSSSSRLVIRKRNSKCSPRDVLVVSSQDHILGEPTCPQSDSLFICSTYTHLSQSSLPTSSTIHHGKSTEYTVVLKAASSTRLLLSLGNLA